MQQLHLEFILEPACLSSGMRFTCRYEREAYGGSYGREPAGYARYFRQPWSGLLSTCGRWKIMSCYET